jgi:glycosidase
MPRVVLLAKNSYVWLEQLSRKYQRFIQHLDEIPEEELEQLARWGFTGLWLIGLWERSPASKTIKHMRGNPDAVASAYSLFEYNIASDLGGEQAYQVLREKATRVGIRLSSDMVPNHMGIDSRWVIEHPEWFIALDYSPYPAYTFNGANLSWDTRVGIYLEDHYFDNTDAAVVFKRVDFHTGDTKYIYHGNDGTSFPWNDTAQLNYLLPEVREAVIQTILHVARKFPIIRFDAAMTLAKRHYQRLWFPEPGSGGDIPSRAEHGLNKAKFEEAFPEEFWRMVVDRVAQEVPETLLLAEAFWLMEGYFVRSLGMHRVYNSAFMNMLRDEKNQQYRQVIKNTVEFDPEILKRYVNFMNNPDERTAVDQFGKGDKYFGICTLMATMPGLPMFGHGQIEGYTEKYGMEFRKPMWDEQVDPYLLERHEREIFPLLRKRWLFAEVQNFLLYDVFTPEGSVNEDIYAYSNRRGDERALVIYHNKYAEARGWIRISAAMPVKAGDGERVLIQQSLGQGLELPDEIDTFVIFKDQISGLEYIHPSHDLHEKGLYVELGAYRYHVFLDFRLLRDNQWHQYAQLSAYLNGRGVPSVEAAITEILLQPILSAFNELANPGFLNWLNVNRLGVQVPRSKKESQVITPNLEAALEEAEQKMSVLLMEIKSFAGGDEPEALVAESFRKDLEMVLKLPELEKQLQIAGKRKDFRGLKFINQPPQIVSQEKRPGSLADMGMEIWGVFYGWIFMHRLGYVLPDHTPSQRRAWLDEWMVTKQLVVALMEMGLDVKKAERVARLSRLLVGREDWFDATLKPSLLSSQALKGWLSDQEVQAFLGINRFQGILWYNREAFEEWVWWIYVLAVVENLGRRTDDDPAVILHEIQQIYEIVRRILAAEKLSGYQVEKLLEAMEV